jgi:peptide/nickel transport system ATP-binding protein
MNTPLVDGLSPTPGEPVADVGMSAGAIPGVGLSLAAVPAAGLPAADVADRGGPAQPLLLVRGLRKYFAVRDAGLIDRFRRVPAKQVHAVDDVSFTLAKGETLGIVGESGCGKSTTARLITRLIDPDGGELVFDGDGVGQYGGMALKTYRRNVQMVFQDSQASLNPRLTIGEAIAYGPRVHGLAKAEATARARALLARVGLAPELFAARYPHELSGGQRQRVNIARALAFEPRLLILDEAVAALDKSVQAQVLNLLQELKAERGLTYLFISHDLHVVHYLADRVMVMYLGQVVEIAPVQALYDRPRHPYTRALLSAIPSMDPARRTQHSPLSGDPPNPIDPPSGCRFRDRCPQAQAVCAQQPPMLRETEPGHSAACHRDDPASGYVLVNPPLQGASSQRRSGAEVAA